MQLQGLLKTTKQDSVKLQLSNFTKLPKVVTYDFDTSDTNELTEANKNLKNLKA